MSNKQEKMLTFKYQGRAARAHAGSGGVWKAQPSSWEGEMVAYIVKEAPGSKDTPTRTKNAAAA